MRAVVVAVAVAASVQASADEQPSDNGLATLQDMEASASMLSDERNAPLDRYCKEMFPEPVFAPNIRAAVVLEGQIRFDDGTFAQGIFEGMEAAARCFGINTSYHTPSVSSERITGLLDGEDAPDIVLSIGFSVLEATLDVARLRPDVQFIGIDQTLDTPFANYIAVSAEDWQVGFLAGVAAGLTSEAKMVGVIAGPKYPPVVAIADGFEDGVAFVDSDITVQRVHLESFIDPLLGVKTAKDFAAQGVDVIFGAAGKTGSSAIKSAAAMELNVVGVDLDQYFTTFEGGRALGSDRILTSAIKRMDVGAFLCIAAVVYGGVQSGSLILDVVNGGVSYSEFHGATVTENFAKMLEKARLDLKNGVVKAPN